MKTTVLNDEMRSEAPAIDSRSLSRRCGNLALGVMLAIVTAGPAMAGPTGGEVVGGEGRITTTGNLTQIDQATGRIAINWDTFNVDTNETVRFVQPGSDSVALNTIFDQNPSQIFGTIEANGRVLLINPNGLIFSPTAQVNVAGLVASSLSISTADFMAGNYTFEDTGSGGMVLNQGTLQAAPGGFIALLGNAVANEGLIVADAGTIAMGAGSTVALDFDGSGLIYFEVESDVLNNALGVEDAVRNSGSLFADGGQVLLTAAAAQDVYTRAINNEGLIQARRIDNQGGAIRLTGGSGTVVSTGVIDATGGDDESTGGTVEMLGGRVGLLGSGSIDVSGNTGGGTVHLGGAAHGAGELTAEFTQVSADASIAADARVSGDGGEVIVWADDSTWFYGSASVTGGSASGNGGFVEISGAQGLSFAGTVDASAANGNLGTLLFDPANITIRDQNDPDANNGADDGDLPDLSNATVGAAGDFEISETGLEGLAANANIVLEATNNITINSLTTDGELALATTTAGSVTFSADTDGDGSGAFTMDTADTISTQGGGLTISGAGVTVGNIVTSGPANSIGGAVNLDATSGNLIVGNITTNGGADVADAQGQDAGSVTLAGEDVNVGAITALGSAATTATNADGADGNVLVNANGSVVLGGNINVSAGQIDIFVDLDEAVTNDAESLEIQGTLTAGTINLNGGSAQQDDTLIVSLTGADTATWNINAAQSGTVVAGASSLASFSDFSDLTGGAQTDNFTVSGTGSLAGTAAGGAGTNTLTGNDSANVWTLDVASNGTVANTNGSVAFTGMSSVTGGGLGDTFNLTAVDWGDVNGGAGNDQFNLNTNQSGQFNGGEGSDTFTIADGVVLSFAGAAIDGGADAAGDDDDEINVAADAGALAVTLTGSTANTGFAGSVATVGQFAGIDTVTGSGDETLTGLNVVSTWTESSYSDGSEVLSFAGIATAIGAGTDTLQGGAGIDTFAVTGAGNVTLGTQDFEGMDTLSGQGNNDIFNLDADFAGTVNGDAGEDEFNLTASQTGSIDGGADADTFNLTAGITVVGGISGGAGGNDVDTLLLVDAGGNPNDANDWTVTGAQDSGTVNGQGLGAVSFSDMENLTGNTRVDNFTFDAALTGDASGGIGDDVFAINLGGSAAGINGGADSDTVTYADPNRVEGVTVAYDTFTSIESLTGSALSDTLTGTSAEDTFTLTAAGVGSATLTAGGEVVGFTSFENVSGLGSNDTFNLNGDFGGTVNGDAGNDQFNLNTNQSGQFNGGEGSDTFTIADGVVLSFAGAAIDGGADAAGDDDDELNIAADAGALAVTLTGSTANTGFAGTVATVGQFAGIDTVTGSGDETLTGLNVVSTWTESSYSDGSEVLSFAGIATAIGAGTDTLQGGAGIDTFAVTGAGNVTLGTQDFEGMDTLSGQGNDDIFNLNADFGGNVNGDGGNDQFNLNTNQSGQFNGGEGSDTFTIADGVVLSFAGAAIDGGADAAGDDDDEINVAADAGALAVTLTGSTANTGFAGSVATVGQFAGIDTVTGSGDETLTGLNVVSTWTESSYSDGSEVLSFAGIATAIGGAGADTLQGGAGSDTFTVTGNGSVTLGAQNFEGMDTLSGQGDGDIFNLNADFGGNVNGDAGDDEFNLAASQTGTVDGGADGANGDVINGTAAANAFVINAINGGTANGTTFANVENLNGGAADDSFTFVGAGVLGGSIDGAGGTNSLDVSGANGGVTVDLATSAATVLNGNAGGGFSNISDFTGDNANDTLIGPNVGATFDTTGINDGTVNGATYTYTDFANITGGSGADTFNLNHDVTGSVNGGDDADTFNLAAGVIIGGSIVGGDGGTDDDELVVVGGAGPNAWVVTSDDTGTLNGQAFSDIENLTGNGNVDNFDIDAIVTGTVAGLGGSDVFDFGGATGNAGFVDGGTGTDSVTFANRTAGVTVDMANVDGVESLTGSTLDDTFNINGNEGNAITIAGGGGTDTVAVVSNSQITGDLTVTDVDAVSIGADLDVGANNISLTVDGAITQSGAGGVLTAQSLATSSVGGQTLNSATGTFTGSNSGSGDINLTNTGDLVISGISQTGGSVSIDTAGALTQAGAVTASGGVSLAATGEVTQSDDITATGDVSVTTTGGNIVMDQGVTTDSNGGDITYETSGTDANITLATLKTCDDCTVAGSTGDVVVRAVDGSILGYEKVNPADAHITAFSVSLIAGESIGTELIPIKLRRINTQGNASNSDAPIFLEFSNEANVDSEVGVDVALSEVANLAGLNLSTVAVAGQVTADQAATQEDAEEVDWAAYSEDITLYEINNEGVQLPEQEEVDEFAKINADEGAVPIALNIRD